MSTTERRTVAIIPIVPSAYSLAHFDAGSSPLSSVLIYGLADGKEHTLSLSVYGLSKVGFFIERSSFSFGRFTVTGEDDPPFCALIPSEELHVKRGFFESLGKPMDGKICIEAEIDGERFRGESAVALTTASVYPSDAPYTVFSSFLYPQNEAVKTLCDTLGDPFLPSLYEALCEKHIIYSMKDCDFTVHDLTVDEPGALLSGGTHVATPLEMARLFASCVLCASLAPLIVVTRSDRGPRFWCGLCERGLFGTAVCEKPAVLAEALASRRAVLFDAACLFTGHSVNFDEAIRTSPAALREQPLIFALDVSFGSAPSVTSDALPPLTLPQCAERLSDTDRSPLLDFQSLTMPFLHFVNPGVFERGSVYTITSAGTKTGEALTAYAAEQFRRKVLVTVHASKSFEDGARRLLRREDGEWYITRGLLSYNGKLAPLCLYPVKLACVSADASGRREYRLLVCDDRPRPNRLLAEYLRASHYAPAFFDKNGLPEGTADEILEYFRTLSGSQNCASDGFSVFSDCLVASFPYRSTRLSFEILDKAPKIGADAFTTAFLAGKAQRPLPPLPNDIDRRTASAERTAVGAFPDVICRTGVLSRDYDLSVRRLDEGQMADCAAQLAADAVLSGHSVLLLTDRPQKLGEHLASRGVDTAALVLSENDSSKESLRQALRRLAASELPDERETVGAEELPGETQLWERYAARTKHYDFDFSFPMAFRAFFENGRGLTADEKSVLLDAGEIYFPDLGRSSASALFDKALALCRAASSLDTPGVPLSRHPLRQVTLTALPDGTALPSLIREATDGEKKLETATKTIADGIGFPIGDILSLPALHAFLSLVVHIRNGYHDGMPQELFTVDVYALNREVDQWKSLSRRIGTIENDLGFLDPAVFAIDAAGLYERFAGDGSIFGGTRNEAAKTIDGFRRENDPERRPVSDILPLLCEHEQLCSERSFLEKKLCSALPVEGGAEAIDEAIAFSKTSDILLKKIYGTDADKRHEMSGLFRSCRDWCDAGDNGRLVEEAASHFDALFSDNDGPVVRLSGILGVDMYALTFEDGVFGENGLLPMLCGWQETIGGIGSMVRYNRAAADCREAGLGSFTAYLEENGYTPACRAIFTRSLLYLAMRQISLDTPHFLSPIPEGEAYEEAFKERCMRTRRRIRKAHLTACAAYIGEHARETESLASLLSDRTLPDEHLRPHGAVIRNLFPVVISAPDCPVVPDGFDTVVFLNADRIPAEKAVPFLHAGTHKVLLSGFGGEDGTLSSRAEGAGIVHILECDEYHPSVDCRLRALVCGGMTGFHGTSAPSVRLIRTPTSSFDKENDVNMLEAQAIGLLLLKEQDTLLNGDTVALAAPTVPQIIALREELTAIAEKSPVIKNAVSEHKLVIRLADSRLTECFDHVILSPVCGKDVAGELFRTFSPMTDRMRGGRLPSAAAAALLAAGKSFTVVSSGDIDVMSPKTDPKAFEGFRALIAFAACGGYAAYPEDRELTDHEVTSLALCDFLRESGREPTVIAGGLAVSYRKDGVTYAVVPEKDNTAAGYDREYRTSSLLRRGGCRVISVDPADLVLNKQKIADTLNEMEEA